MKIIKTELLEKLKEFAEMKANNVEYVEDIGVEELRQLILDGALWMYEEIKKDKSIKFEIDEWNSLHDTILSASNYEENLSSDELQKIFESMPEDLQDDAIHWGFSDSVVSDNIYEWYMELEK